MRPHLVALAPTAAALVRGAGGWLFDRVMAGWEVTALVADHTDTRPLRILGVRVADLTSCLTTNHRGPRPQAIAVDTELCSMDVHVRDRLSRVLEQGQHEEVTLWGDGSAADFGRPVDPVLHHLSYAARAFKSQALAAVAAPVSVHPDEMFRSYELLPSCRAIRDLVPMS
ncbi:hypothetical protein ACFO5K_19085 [Nocardia halotolerans]|uniref:Uncharacterized protein n=1 Tax=Nocardia halotolerans TaxID=1755878 RepID=A0ABV8VNG3_9NOCA